MKNLFFIHKKFNYFLLPLVLLFVLFLAVTVCIFNNNPMDDAYIVYSDGEVVTAMHSIEEINELLNDMKAEYKTPNNEVCFQNDVEIKKALIEKSEIKRKNEAKKLLEGYKEELVIHTAKENETIDSIASYYKTNVESVIELNPMLIPEYISEGTEITVKAKVPVIQIKTISYVKEFQEVEYDTVIKKDDSVYEGETYVSSEGENGEMNVIYKVIKIDGNEKSKNKVREEVIVAPKNKVILAGVKPRPKKEATGEFVRPYNGNISSRFGRRWGRNHNGVDLTGAVGDIINASDGGEVIHAGWNNGGFGNLVIIKHKNGYESYYAHLSAVLVSKGQMVAKDEPIGKLGNTGRSTGPHLHFEIRKDGVPVDPLKKTD